MKKKEILKELQETKEMLSDLKAISHYDKMHVNSLKEICNGLLKEKIERLETQIK